MEMKLNIYKKGEIVKTYTASEFDLMWGTVEDLLNVIDVDKLDDAVAIGKAVISVLPQVKPLLKQIFRALRILRFVTQKPKNWLACLSRHLHMHFLRSAALMTNRETDRGRRAVVLI